MKEEAKRRMMIESILHLAKENGCEVYICPKGKGNFGYIIFQDQTIMGVFDGVFYGWDLYIMHPETETHSKGTRCDESESVTSVTWEVLLEEKEKGTQRIKDLGIDPYGSVEEWKRANEGKVVQL